MKRRKADKWRRPWGPRLIALAAALVLWMALGFEARAADPFLPPGGDLLGRSEGDPLRLAGGRPFISPAIEPLHVPIPGGIGRQPCFRCHFEGMGTVVPQEDLPRKYSIQSAFRSYWDSPHGRMRTLGERNAPRCEDCHLTREWREILPQEHPDSPVNPRNLAKICAKCHGRGMLNARVMDGSMHLELRTRSLVPGGPVGTRYGFLPGITKLEASYYLGPIDLVAWVNFLFLVLTVGTLVSLTLFMLLDLNRKLCERRAERREGEDEKS